MLKRLKFYLMVWVVLCAAVTGARVEAADAAPDPYVLVKDLQSDDFDKRASAAVKLEELGEKARSALEIAQKSTDLDVRQLATRLLGKLECSTVTFYAFDRNGKPAAGAELDLTMRPDANSEDEQPAQGLTFDAAGKKSLDQKLGQTYWMSLNAKHWSLLPYGNPQRNLDFDLGDNPVFLTLTRGGTFSLKVKDGKGAPLKDVQATILQSFQVEPQIADMQAQLFEQNWSHTKNLTGTTDDAGNLKIEDIPDGVYNCVLRREGLALKVLPAIRIRENEITDAAPAVMDAQVNGKIELSLLNIDGSAMKDAQFNAMVEPIYDGMSLGKKRQVRYIRQQYGLQLGQNLKTDENGKLSIPDLKPGKYRLAMLVNNLRFAVDEAVVAPGATANLGVLKPPPAGTISGRVVSATGEALQNCTAYAIPEKEFKEFDVATGFWRYGVQEYFLYNRAITAAAGTYEIKNVAAGAYTLMIVTQQSNLIVIGGIQVEAGKTVKAPDATVPAPKDGGVIAPQIKGVIVLPDGKPAAGAIMAYTYANGGGTSGYRTDANGVFSFNPGQNGGIVKISATLQKYKPASIDLTAPGIKLQEIKLQLEKQNYGTLVLKVQDEAGKPISGVNVTSVRSSRVYYYRSVQHKNLTNSEGEARVEGLACGQRVINLFKRGLRIKGDGKVTIQPDVENKLTLVMQKGLVVAGKVEFPADAAPKIAVVSLNGQKYREQLVSESGAYRFEGVLPGEYNLNVSAPGLLAQESSHVSIKADQPADATVKLVLFRNGCAAVKLPAAFAQSSCSLIPAGEWKKEDGKSSLKGTASGAADADGRVEFIAPPGNYDLQITPSRDSFAQYGGYEGRSHVMDVTQIIEGIVVKPLQNIAEMRTLPAVAVSPVAGTAMAKGHLVIKQDAKTANRVNFILTLAGSRARASMNYWANEFSGQKNNVPIFIGAQAGDVYNPVEPGQFIFKSLPAGDYKITISATSYGNGEPLKGKPVELKAFTIKDGEELNLDALTFQVPEDISKHAATTAAQTAASDFGDDLEPTFKP